MYYLSSENKGADQLRGYREADLRLCFRLCRLLVFPWGGSIIIVSIHATDFCFCFTSFLRYASKASKSSYYNQSGSSQKIVIQIIVQMPDGSMYLPAVQDVPCVNFITVLRDRKLKRWLSCSLVLDDTAQLFFLM